MKKTEGTYRIVVGHDLEATGDRALAEALTMASRIPDTELHVVYAMTVSSGKKVAVNERRLDDALLELRSRVQVALAGRSIRTQLHVRIGKPVETIIQVAVDYDASVILVGTHGRTGLDRLRSRSVAERLVRTAPLPVHVAHEKSFANLAPTTFPDPARPGEDLHRGRALTELMIVSERVSHISGLV
jgi:nucleotide-binding universal stress UspA family protein